MDWVLNNASLILLLLAGFLILFGALLGLLRGFKRAFIRFLTVLIAFFGSLFVCKFFLANTRKVLSYDWMQKLLTTTGADEYVEKMETNMPAAYDLLIGIPVAFLAPIVFTVLFLVAAFFLELVSMIIGFFAGKRKGRLLGALIGAVQGAVVTVAILVPLCGLLSTAVSTIETLEAEADADSETIEQLADYKEQMEAVTEAPVYKLVDKIGSPVCDGLMRYKVDNDYISVRKEANNIARLVAHVMVMNKDIKEYDQTQITAMNNMVEDIDQSTLMKRLITEVLNAAGKAWERDGQFFDNDAPDVGKDFEKVMKALYQILATTSEDPVSDAVDAKSVIATDLQTLVDLMDVLEKHGIFPIIDDSDKLSDKFSNDPDLIKDCRKALRSNKRFDPVCNALEDMAFKAVVTNVIEIPEKGASQEYAEYHSMTTEVANAVNNVSEEDKEAFLADPQQFIADNLENALKDYLKDENDEIPEDVDAMISVTMDLIADAIVNDEDLKDKIENNEDITADDIEEFLNKIRNGTAN